MPLPRAFRPGFDAMGRFSRQEDGGLLIFGLFTIICMALAVGVGIDTLRYEVQRTKIQNTADRAVLAAADLDETRNPTEVVNDYFARAGLDPSAVNVTITPTVGGKTVSANTTVSIRSFFLHMVGLPRLEGPAIGTATETVTDVEVVLVLDNSGSMNSNNRLNLLKTAAKQFVDDVVKDDTGQGTVAISIVPFATQVAAGAELTDFFNVSDEHGFSTCVDWVAADFTSTSVDVVTPRQRTGHLDPWTYNSPVRNNRLVCPTDANREILLWSQNKTDLKDKIDAMWARGNTSIDVATKWGATLLDPSTRPLLTQKILDGTASVELTGMPHSYTRPNTKKYLVVMSDGQNTTQYRVNNAYKSGNSTLWKDPATDAISHYIESTGQYYDIVTGDLLAQPLGGASAVNLTWPEAMNEMSAGHYARYVKAAAEGGRWQDTYNAIVTNTGSGTKNTRASQICKAARDQGVTVFSIGMDTYGQGDATLLDCVGGEENSSYFFDVVAKDIDDAFAAIARQINHLRLTQ